MTEILDLNNQQLTFLVKKGVCIDCISKSVWKNSKVCRECYVKRHLFLLDRKSKIAKNFKKQHRKELKMLGVWVD